MTMSEVETAVRMRLNGLVALVFNNNNYGTIRAHQAREFPDRYVASDLGFIDFAISCDPGGMLRKARAIAKSGFSQIAGPRVYLIEFYHLFSPLRRQGL